jgi:hypothetical protein
LFIKYNLDYFDIEIINKIYPEKTMKKNNVKAICVLTAIFFIAALAGCSGSSVKNGGAPQTRLCINKIESEGVDTKITTRLTAGLHKKLQELKGTERVVSREIDGISKSANRQLTGRIGKLGEKYVITIKVIEGEKGRLVFNETDIVKESGLDSTIEDIAGKIADKDEVWE